MREIERLRRRVNDDVLVRDLREAVRLSVTAETIAAPTTHSRLLDMIVATAAEARRLPAHHAPISPPIARAGAADDQYEAVAGHASHERRDSRRIARPED